MIDLKIKSSLAFQLAAAASLETLSADVQHVKVDLNEFKDFVAESFAEINGKIDAILQALRNTKPAPPKRKAALDENPDDGYKNQRLRKESDDDVPTQPAAQSYKRTISTQAQSRKMIF